MRVDGAQAQWLRHLIGLFFCLWLMLFVVFFVMIKQQIEDDLQAFANRTAAAAATDDPLDDTYDVALIVDTWNMVFQWSGGALGSFGSLLVHVFVVTFVVVFTVLFSWQMLVRGAAALQR